MYLDTFNIDDLPTFEEERTTGKFVQMARFSGSPAKWTVALVVRRPFPNEDVNGPAPIGSPESTSRLRGYMFPLSQLFNSGEGYTCAVVCGSVYGEVQATLQLCREAHINGTRYTSTRESWQHSRFRFTPLSAMSLRIGIGIFCIGAGMAGVEVLNLVAMLH